MTEEDQKLRDRLAEVEQISRGGLTNINGDPKQYGTELVSGMGRIVGIACRYMLDRIDRTGTCQCQVCRKPLGDGQAHRIWFGPPDALPANAVLCTDCYDFMLAPLRAAMMNKGQEGRT
jgi:hypothetical protein